MLPVLVVTRYLPKLRHTNPKWSWPISRKILMQSWKRVEIALGKFPTLTFYHSRSVCLSVWSSSFTCDVWHKVGWVPLVVVSSLVRGRTARLFARAKTWNEEEDTVIIRGVVIQIFLETIPEWLRRPITGADATFESAPAWKCRIWSVQEQRLDCRSIVKIYAGSPCLGRGFFTLLFLLT